jgi:hypothetical protein
MGKALLCFSDWRFSSSGLDPAVDGHKDRIRIFIAIGVFAKLASGSAAIMLPRLIWVVLADPTTVAEHTAGFTFAIPL